MSSKDEQPTPDADSIKAKQLGRLKDLGDKISPEREAELEGEYSVRAHSIREAGENGRPTGE